MNSSTRRQVISNFIISGGTTQVQVLNDGTRMAQGFGAGRHGATASALLLKFARWNTGVEVTVSVWTTDQNSDVPKELVMTFTGPDTPGTGEQTFLPDEEWNIVRGHSTRDEEGKLILLGNYLIVIESTATAGAEAHLEMTTHTGHEPSGANWGIANRRVSDLTTDPPTTDTEMLSVRIQGAYEAAPPEKPTDLAATPNGQNRIDLSWEEPEDNDDPITGYPVETSPNGFVWEVLTYHTRSTDTAYAHKGLDPNTTRYYRVLAINGQGQSEYSDEADATTAGESALTRLTATASGPRQIDLSWTAPTNWDETVDGYQVQSSIDGSAFTTLVDNTDSTGTTYSHTGLSPDTTRHYRVLARSGTDLGDPSNSDSATTDALTVSFEAATYTVAEGDDTTTTAVKENEVTVKVVLNTYPDDDLTVPITKTEQDGASSSDYSGVPANVTFDASDEDTEKEFTFTATTDDVDDDDESVKLTFGMLPEEVTAGGTDETVVNITDDDDPQVTVSFEQSAYTVDEGDDLTIKVVLSADPERTLSVPFSATDLETTSVDYSLPDFVTFNRGQT